MFLGEIKIVGFYTLSIKSLKLSNDISTNKKKKINGGFLNKDNKNVNNVAVYLIGQLAKNDTYSKCIAGKELMERAMISINTCHNIIGGRIVLIECNGSKKLSQFYNNCGFEELQKDVDGLVQMISYL